jgi:Leucine-rich repeat (LRR) protein
MIGAAARALRAASGARPPALPCVLTQQQQGSGFHNSFRFASTKVSDSEKEEKEEERGVFHSLKRASAKSKQVVELNLSASDDFTCLNIMCSKLGEPCLCRASVVLGKFKNLEKLDISRNRLATVPESLHQLERLESLNIANNPLESFPEELMLKLKQQQMEITLVLDKDLWGRYERDWLKWGKKNNNISFRIVSDK